MRMPLGELRQRSAELHAQQEADGRLTRGQRTYRKRLKRALETSKGMQDYAKARGIASKGKFRLTPEQRYDEGYDMGTDDAIFGHPSKETTIMDEMKRKGYHCGYVDHRMVDV